MKAIYCAIILAMVGCVAPERTYNVTIYNQGDENTVRIEVKADVPQDYDVSSKADVDVSVIP